MEVRMRKWLIIVAICLIATVGIGKPQNKSITVEKIVVATTVADNEPSGEGKEFPVSVGNLYCWTKIDAQSVPTTIKHKWYRGDQQVFEYSLDLKWASTRTWSRKSVTPGKWRVEVTDEGGAVLSSVDFVVK